MPSQADHAAGWMGEVVRQSVVCNVQARFLKDLCTEVQVRLGPVNDTSDGIRQPTITMPSQHRKVLRQLYAAVT